ncbi:MAG: Hpt domain-containing protein [Deltaproteobacteria bacterium]|nr:Hpt domain-containing protein [Deltaproteobacteria bacterium]
MALVALLHGMSVTRALLYTTFVLLGPTLAHRFVDRPRVVSMVLGVTSMLMAALLVHFGQGPMQIEMHFYFFVLLALQTVFANPTVIIVSALAVALHHLVLFCLLPASVFNYDASLWTVLVHALFVVLESAAACFVARSFFDDVIGLDRLVRDRTAALAQRNRDLQLVLDNVEQGLVTIDLSGRVVGARASIVDRWFGAPPSSDNLCDWLALGNREFAEWLRLGLDELAADVMPRALVLAQLPSSLVFAGRELRFSYLPIDGPRLQLLVVMSEVTAMLARAAQDRRDREIGLLVERSARDPSGVAEFLDETSRLVRRVADGALGATERRRALHTLKGNAGSIGLSSIAVLCDEVETRLQSGDASLDDEAAQVAEAWRALHDRLEPVLGARAAHIHITPAQWLSAAEQVRQWSTDLARTMLGWGRDPLSLRLHRLGEQASALAVGLGKPIPQIEIDAEDLRLPRRRYAALWQSLAHAVRNAVDHGLEASEEERAAAGKPRVGRLVLGARHTAGALVVCITDDGRGVNWAELASAATRRGLAARTEEDLRRAFFADGVSTRSTVTEISGRGSGMGALREAACRLGGHVEVESEAGRGTTVRVVVPMPERELEHELASARRSFTPEVVE